MVFDVENRAQAGAYLRFTPVRWWHDMMTILARKSCSRRQEPMGHPAWYNAGAARLIGDPERDIVWLKGTPF